MPLFLEIVDDSGSGARFPIRPGTTVGRRDADVSLSDAKVSLKHAFIESRQDGYYLVDLGSVNGLKVDGKKVSEVLLEEDVEVQVGTKRLRVIQSDFETGMGVLGAWIPVVQGLVDRALETVQDRESEMRAFDPPITLRFVQGRQFGTEWTLGYGPREIGSASVDLPIEEPNAPALCFELVPEGSGLVTFRTRHRNLVRLNGQEISAAAIGDSDTIDIEHTRIQIVSGGVRR